MYDGCVHHVIELHTMNTSIFDGPFDISRAGRKANNGLSQFKLLIFGSSWILYFFLFFKYFIDISFVFEGKRSLKSGCQQGGVPSGGSRGRGYLPLPAPGGSWQPLARGHITPTSASVLTGPALCGSPCPESLSPFSEARCYPSGLTDTEKGHETKESSSGKGMKVDSPTSSSRGRWP